MTTSQLRTTIAERGVALTVQEISASLCKARERGLLRQTPRYPSERGRLRRELRWALTRDGRSALEQSLAELDAAREVRT